MEILAFYEMFCMQHTLLRDKIIFFEEWNGLEGVQNAILFMKILLNMFISL